ncbi:hypothetical protein LJB90_01840 [Eubacteriales bacterium OttesenSCG-928-G02]|nr:hypothetical protein [Eubacteriales bacterium OttesenSCG-928-G02]
MTVSSDSKDDIYHSQADFTQDLRKFADKYNVHVHLVVHQRKSQGGKETSADDVLGLGTITNIACNVFSISRADAKVKSERNCDSVVTCQKKQSIRHNRQCVSEL